MSFKILEVKNNSSGYWGAFETSDDDYQGQLFGVGQNLFLIAAKLRLYRDGNIGTITIEIQETTSGVPNGTVLTSCSLNGDSLTTNTEGEWLHIPLSCSLLKDTDYCIVIKAPSQAVNHLIWVTQQVGSYRNGLVYTQNGGSSWTTGVPYDSFFIIYGRYEGTKGTSEISKRYPVTEGLTAKTTKQTKRIMNLVPQKSLLRLNDKVGL